MIDVWYTNFTLKPSREIWDLYFQRIPTGLRDKICRFHRWQDQTAGLLGKILLLEGLSEYGYPSDCLNGLSYTEYGRPFLSGAIDFNISHSGEYVVCAISDTAKVGVDIERRRSIELKDFDNYMTPAQWEAIYASSRPFEKFFEFWTIKESVLKVDGRGLSLSLLDIQVDGDKALTQENIWHINRIDLHSDYSCHLATDMKNAPIELKPFVY